MPAVEEKAPYPICQVEEPRRRLGPVRISEIISLVLAKLQRSRVKGKAKSKKAEAVLV